MKTINEVAKITGVSTRTLRYYDEIGLLKPTAISEAGYRLYNGKALEKLQEIMFFRELEIPLAEIQKIMDNPSLDREQMLAAQKSMLEQKRNRLNGIIELISDVMKGVNTMQFGEFEENDITAMIETMKQNMPKEQLEQFIEKYGGGSLEAYHNQLKQTLNRDETKTSLIKWYGNKQNIIEAYKPVENMEDLRVEMDMLQKDFAVHIGSCNEEQEHAMVAKLGDLYKKMLNLENARNFLLDLAKEYLQGDKLAEAQDKQYGVGTAKYMGEAIQRYYGMLF